jgi:hypothetical protein
MESSHPSPTRGASQADIILGRLQSTPGEWVSVLELHEISRSLAVHSRINDLRNRGYVIEHKNERPSDSTAVHSFYRIRI